MGKRVIAGALILLATSFTAAEAGFDQRKAEKFAKKNSKYISCYYLYGLKKDSKKQDVAESMITAKAYIKGLGKKDVIYALGFGSGKIAAMLEADRDKQEQLISKHIKHCK